MIGDKTKTPCLDDQGQNGKASAPTHNGWTVETKYCIDLGQLIKKEKITDRTETQNQINPTRFHQAMGSRSSTSKTYMEKDKTKIDKLINIDQTDYSTEPKRNKNSIRRDFAVISNSEETGYEAIWSNEAGRTL